MLDSAPSEISTYARETAPQRRRRVFIGKTDPIVAMDLKTAFERLNCEVLAPAFGIMSAADAVQRHRALDFALLDLDHSSGSVFQVADYLIRSGVQTAFMASAHRDIPADLAQICFFQKPFLANEIASAALMDRQVLSQPIQNRLLRALPADVVEHLRPHMTLVQLPRRDVAKGYGRQLRQVWFVETGLCIMMAPADDGPVGVALVGRDGLLGATAVIGASMDPTRWVALKDSTAIEIGVDVLAASLKRSQRAQEVILRYINNLFLQLFTSVASASKCTVEQRLARALLMCSDRLGANMPLTQDQLSEMLGCRRAGITEAMSNLAGQGGVSTRRGLIEIKNRSIMLKAAGKTYGIAEQDYENLVRDYRERGADGRTTQLE